jgi:hypothetical protein
VDVTSGATVAGLLIGLVCGVPAGMLVAAVRRSWADVATAKAAVPKARKGARSKTAEAFLLCFLLMIAVALALGARANGWSH